MVQGPRMRNIIMLLDVTSTLTSDFPSDNLVTFLSGLGKEEAQGGAISWHLGN